MAIPTSTTTNRSMKVIARLSSAVRKGMTEKVGQIVREMRLGSSD
jgi:hypothetical protein